MMKRGKRILSLVILAVLIILIFLNIILNEIYFSNITAKASSQGSVQLTITTICGNGFCDGIETCSSCPADCGACIVPPTGDGGGGGTTTIKPPVIFTLDKDLIKVNTKVGETFKVSLKINNTYSSALDFDIKTNLNDLIIFSEERFSVGKGMEKEIFLTFYTTDNTEPGIYTGEIEVSSKGVVKKIPVIFEVESKKVLFDVSLDIPPEYKELFPGEDLLLQLIFFNIGDIQGIDVFVTYFIKDFQGNVILTQEETVSVETQISFSRTIKLPSDLEVGDYVAAVQIKYGSSVGTSSDIFHIISEKEFIFEKYYFLIFLVILLIVIIIIILIRREHKKLKKSMSSYHKEIKRASKKVKEEKKKAIRANRFNQKLKSKFGVLKKAYSEGYIQRKSYERGVKKIKSVHNKLKRKYL